MNTQLTTRNAQRAPAFTLIEMVTVLTIIIIVLAIAIPVWDALMNGTNLAAAQNQIAAYIANARSDAIYNRQTIGVFFFIDPKSKQTAMVEVQVQTLYQPFPPGASAPTPKITNQFQPGTWTYSGSGVFNWSMWQAYPPAPMPTSNNGPTYSLELVNSPDPNSNPPKNIYYRDPVILPKGVGIALSNSTYTYNQNNLWKYPPTPASLPPLDRYIRLGCIMFNSDGTLASIPWGVPYYEAFNLAQYTSATNPPPTGTGPIENLLCKNIGMYPNPNTNSISDLASGITYNPGATNITPQFLPLMSSVGFVIYDRDVFLNQHANSTTVMDNTTPSNPTATSIGDGAQFTDNDLNYSLIGGVAPTTINAPTIGSGSTAVPAPSDKFLEEDWIDKNGIAFLVSPNSGSLIKAK